MGREDEIKDIAFAIWQEEGCCDGRDVDHWLRAEAIWEELKHVQPSKVAEKKVLRSSVTKAKKAQK